MKGGEGVALMISSDFPPIAGGQARYLWDLWSSLPGKEVALLVPAVEGDREVDAQLSCRVFRRALPLGPGRLSKLRKALRLLWEAGRLCRRLRVRALHCGQVFSAGFAGYGCRALLGIPYYPYVHGADLLEFGHRPLWGRWLRRILKGAEKVVVNSRFTGRAVAACGVEEERIAVVHPGVDLRRFAAPLDRGQARHAWGWEGKKVVLSVGRLVERKGQDTVIRALPQVAALVPQVHYAIGGEGPCRERLERLAVEMGVAQRVEFLGFVPEGELARRYGAADLFAMVSREISAAGDVEGFGIVYLEANAAGTAVLGGRSGGVGDAVLDGYSGLLVDPEDVEAVAQALARLLRDEELRQALARQGQTRVREHFDHRKQAVLLWEQCR
jgi:phosphatidylinositol alpha-1,6-mannosyltransferase